MGGLCVCNHDDHAPLLSAVRCTALPQVPSCLQLFNSFCKCGCIRREIVLACAHTLHVGGSTLFILTARRTDLWRDWELGNKLSRRCLPATSPGVDSDLRGPERRRRPGKDTVMISITEMVQPGSASHSSCGKMFNS